MLPLMIQRQSQKAYAHSVLKKHDEFCKNIERGAK